MPPQGDKIDRILSTVTSVQIDTSAMKQNLETLNENSAKLFDKADEHGERIAKVEVKADNTDETLTRHLSGAMPSRNGGLSARQRTALLMGGGSVGGAGVLYGIVELLKLWSKS